MSYGREEKPCVAYRPWKGQEPLCGNCAWEEKDHKTIAACDPRSGTGCPNLATEQQNRAYWCSRAKEVEAELAEARAELSRLQAEREEIKAVLTAFCAAVVTNNNQLGVETIGQISALAVKLRGEGERA